MPIQSAPNHKQVTFSTEVPRTVKKFNVRDPVSALHLPRSAVINLPNRTSDEVMELLEKQKVVVVSLHYNFNHIRGSVFVKNLSFHKQVLVRYTFDNWKSGSDRRAQYKGPVAHMPRGFVDEFIFEIDLQSSSKPTKLCFALLYRADGAEHWDNNYGKDYQVEYTFTGSSRDIQKFYMPIKPIQKSSFKLSQNSEEHEQFDIPEIAERCHNPQIQTHKKSLTRCPSFDTYVAQTSYDYNMFHMSPLLEMTELY